MHQIAKLVESIDCPSQDDAEQTQQPQEQQPLTMDVQTGEDQRRTICPDHLDEAVTYVCQYCTLTLQFTQIS